jgi:hypothetical protein
MMVAPWASPQQSRRRPNAGIRTMMGGISRYQVFRSLSEAFRATVAWADPSRELYAKILLDEFLASCDFITRDMASRRMAGFSWEETGRVHGMSAHAAEQRVWYVFQQVRGKLKI